MIRTGIMQKKFVILHIKSHMFVMHVYTYNYTVIGGNERQFIIGAKMPMHCNCTCTFRMIIDDISASKPFSRLALKQSFLQSSHGRIDPVHSFPSTIKVNLCESIVLPYPNFILHQRIAYPKPSLRMFPLGWYIRTKGLLARMKPKTTPAGVMLACSWAVR